MLVPNKFGKYKKADVLEHGYEILEGGMTATDIEKTFNIKIPPKERLEYCIGFRYKKEWRGCVPVFDIAKIMKLKQKDKNMNNE